MFCHLHAHSNFTFHAGTLHPEQLVDLALEFGMESVALTDRNGTYGLNPFYQHALERGIKPILGVELDASCAKPDAKRRLSRERAVVLARDREGYALLCEWTSRRHLHDSFNLADTLAQRSDRVYVILFSAALLREVVGKSGPKGIFCGLINHGDLSSRRRCNRLYRLAAELQVPVLACSDVYFGTSADYEIHRVLRAIGLCSTVSRVPPEELAHPRQYFVGPEEMGCRFARAPEALRNTIRLAEGCEVDLALGQWKFPPFPVPEYETAESVLHQLARAGFRERYPDPSEAARRRFSKELSVINRLGFAPYFLAVHDIARRTSERGIPSLGRGSAACSLISYCLKMTHVDPLAYDLYFERFLNPTRKSPPDIDLDFDWKRRDEIIEMVYETYGAERVAMISTTNRFAGRSAFRETAKAHGLPDREISQLTRRFPWISAGNLPELLEAHPDCQGLGLKNPTYRKLILLGAGLANFPRHLGIHCAGIVIAPDRLTRYLGLERAAKGLVVTQPDMHPVEALGLIKIDLLGNRSLGVLPDCLAEIRRQGHPAPDLSDHEKLAADPLVARMLVSGKTMGCFYIESPAMRSLLQQLKVSEYIELVAASSVIRPGVAQSGMMRAYIERKNDPRKAHYLHPLMEQLLAETYGVMIYQEDVIKVAHQIGGLTLAEADLLRRAMSGKLRSHKAMQALKSRFMQSCRRQDIVPPIADEIWRQIKSFSGYAFCKAHSASFAKLSYQVAYLKAHHPAAFMAAVLSNQGGFYGPWAYLSECRRMGLEIRLPDINASQNDYIGDGCRLQIGLMAIKGMDTADRLRLLDARAADGPFVDLEALITRSRLGPQALRNLIRVGACDSLGPTRPQLAWLLEKLLRSRTGPGHLFDGLLEPPELGQPDVQTRCLAEYELLGYTVTRHPLELLASQIPADVLPAARMLEAAGRRVRMAGWLIAAKPIRTRTGERMKFLSMEDTSATFEVTLFPQVYQRYARLTHHAACLFEGKIELQSGVPSLTASRLAPLDIKQWAGADREVRSGMGCGPRW